MAIEGNLKYFKQSWDIVLENVEISSAIKVKIAFLILQVDLQRLTQAILNRNKERERSVWKTNDLYMWTT